MPAKKRQVAVFFTPDQYARLQRLADERRQTYAEVFDAGMVALSETSPPLVVYAALTPEQREPWRAKIQALRASGISCAAVGKQLYREHGLSALDGLPLGASTVRSVLALASYQQRHPQR